MTREPTAPRARRAPLGLMARVGLAMMLHDKVKLAGTLAGVIFAVVLTNQQAATFMGLIEKNVMFVRHAGADIWIAPRGTETLQTGGAFLPDSAVTRARTTPGVAWSAPLLLGVASMSLPAGGTESVSVVGTRAPEFRGGPWNVVAGSARALAEPDTMIFEDSEREKLGGLNVGSVREVSGHRTRVGGFTWGLIPFGPSYAFAEYDYARLLLHGDSDRTHFVLVGLAPGHDAREVARALAARIPEARVFTQDEFRASTVRYVLLRTQIGVTFGTSALFGLIVGFVIVALAMFSAVVDNLREFGTLKAVGATTLNLAALLLAQGIALALAGSLVGLAIVSGLAEAVRSPKFGMVVSPAMLGATTAVMVVLCMAASTLALLRLRKVEPGMVFR